MEYMKYLSKLFSHALTLPLHPSSKTLLPPSLNRKSAHSQKSRQDQRTSRKDRRTGIQPSSMNSNDRRTQAGNAIEETSYACTCAAVWCWEDFWRAVGGAKGLASLSCRGIKNKSKKIGIMIIIIKLTMHREHRT